MDAQLQIAALTAIVANLAREVAALRNDLQSLRLVPKTKQADKRQADLQALVTMIANAVKTRSVTLRELRADPDLKEHIEAFGPHQLGCALRNAVKRQPIEGFTIEGQDRGRDGKAWRFNDIRA